MVSVRNIMTLEVQTVSPDVSLRELAELLSAAHVTGAPVVAGRQLVGVVSGSDLLEFISASPGVPAGREQSLEWGEWPGPDAWESGAETPSSYFAGYWEDAGADVVERIRVTDSPEWNVLEEHTVSEIMTRTLVTLPPDASARKAARLMLEAGIHRILVMEDGELSGVVTTTDLVKAVSQHGLGA